MKKEYYQDYIGQTYGRLFVQSVDRTTQAKPKFSCDCLCGNSTVVDVHSIISGKTQSCGCLKREITSERFRGALRPSVSAGDRFINKSGLAYRVVKYELSKRILIRFEESGYEKWCALKEIKNGKIRDLLTVKEPVVKEKKVRTKASPTTMIVGDVFGNKSGDEYEVLEILDGLMCKVKFKDWYGYECIVSRSYARSGISNPFRKVYSKVGYRGVGEYDSVNAQTIFTLWSNMLTRCYDERVRERALTYAECTVVDEWHNFQTFAKWCLSQPQWGLGWYLDKDILVKGNKTYGPATCTFVPREVNNLFTLRGNDRGDCPVGVHMRKDRYIAQVNQSGKRVCLGRFSTAEAAFACYKAAKEFDIQRHAEINKDKLSSEAYLALMNYKIEMND